MKMNRKLKQIISICPYLFNEFFFIQKKVCYDKSLNYNTIFAKFRTNKLKT